MAGGSWRIRRFEWDDRNREHIAGHGVDEEEVEEVFRGRLYVRRIRKKKRVYHTVLGLGASGRPLFVVVERIGSRAVRVITARDMKLSERRLFARRAR